MGNFKVRVNSEAEAEDVKHLAVKAGYRLDALFGKKWSYEFCYLLLCEDMSAGFGNEIMADGDKPLSIGELRAMIEPMKEYLQKRPDGTYVHKTGHGEAPEEWIEIPEGAEVAIQFKDDPDEHGVIFYKNGGESCMGENDNNWQHDSEWSMGQLLNENYHDGDIDLSHWIIWQRAQSLNDQYAEIEQVRQASKDNVDHPSHYTQGKVECIDALASATIGKSGIEAVCVANVIKYLWRYEEKNGLEDVKKAQWYLERLVASMGS